jgi:hypothetical protein
MTSPPLGHSFETTDMEKGQDQIPDEGLLMTKMRPIYKTNKQNKTVITIIFDGKL